MAVIKKDLKNRVALENEAAMLQGMNDIAKGYQPGGTASQRAAVAMSNLSEQDAKLKHKKPAKIPKEDLEKVQDEISKERTLKSNIAQAKAKETGIKKEIATATAQHAAWSVEALNVQKEGLNESDQKEKRKKAEAAKEAARQAVLEHEKSVLGAKNAKKEMQIAKSNKITATKQESTAKLVAQHAATTKGYGCELTKDGKKMKLEESEKCSKNKAEELVDTEKTAKQDSKTREEEIKVLESQEKDKERRAKAEQKQKKAAPESQEKDKERRAKAE